MNGAEVLDVGRSALWLTIQLSAPVLIVGVVVGVVIGLMQALTQVQEATLIFAPKIMAIFLALLLLLPLMGAMLGGLLIGLIEVFWSAYFTVEYKDVAAFSILAIVLIFLPSGLLGNPEGEKV